MQTRLDRAPESMRIRRQTAEHPFATIKLLMGSAHFLTRTLDRVSTEMSLHVLAYNMKRMMDLLGVGALIEAFWADTTYAGSYLRKFVQPLTRKLFPGEKPPCLLLPFDQFLHSPGQEHTPPTDPGSRRRID